MGTDITNKLNSSHSRKGKFQRKPRTLTELWDAAINYHRAAKLTKELIDRMGLQNLSELSGYSTSYISTIERMSVNKQYILAMQRIKQVLNETF
jgi:hypothetical protein